MSVRKWMAGAAVALVARPRRRVVGGGTAVPQSSRQRRSRSRSSPTSAASTTRASTLSRTTASRARSASSASRVASSSRRARRTTSRTSTAGAKRLRPRDRGRLPDGRLDRRGRQEVPEDEVRDHRLHRGRASRASRRTSAASCSPSRRQGASPVSPPRTCRSQTGTIASVGGLKIPPVDAFIAGYQYCAKQVKPGIKTLNGYSQDFVAQDKCKELALDQIDQGSDVVFQVAGGCGLGALVGGARTRTAWGIGVDNDQAFLGPHVLTSAHEEGRRGRLRSTIKLVKDGKFKGGVDGRLQREERRRRLRQGQRQGAGPRRADREARTWARSRSPPARSSRRAHGSLNGRSGTTTVDPRGRASARPALSFSPSRWARSFSESARSHRISPRWPTAPTVLEMRHITKRFPGIVANDDVDFDLARARCTRCSARTAPASRR